jgi:hypothetical protein
MNACFSSLLFVTCTGLLLFGVVSLFYSIMINNYLFLERNLKIRLITYRANFATIVRSHFVKVTNVKNRFLHFYRCINLILLTYVFYIFGRNIKVRYSPLDRVRGQLGQGHQCLKEIFTFLPIQHFFIDRCISYLVGRKLAWYSSF